MGVWQWVEPKGTFYTTWRICTTVTVPPIELVHMYMYHLENKIIVRAPYGYLLPVTIMY